MRLDDLPKQYDPKAAQDRWYALWLERGYFRADPSSAKPPYTIVIPPPNVTGALHLGHGLNNTIQDILIRWRRMQGYDALWMPGTDHAGIATQAVVERRLLEEEKKTRRDVGREALVERIWAWKDQYEARILGQLRLMGCSCDWSRTRFTLDEMCAKAVRATFFSLFKEGKIYRGKRLVNWDAALRTAVADDEIEYKEVDGQLWTIRYEVEGESVEVSTTRPETMLGDTAIAVHPSDPRYLHLIGKMATLPLVGRQIPVVGDALLVDPAFGTGVVKVTPAHDPNDYATGVRHDLPMINLLNPDGTYNENAGIYENLDRREVRKRVVADLDAAGHLSKVAPHKNRVGYSDRSKTPIEPYLSDQWFVRMDEFADQAMAAVNDGRVQITPERYAKSYLDWLGEKRDWCISRQLWWGHRIPVWSFPAGTELANPDQTSSLSKSLEELRAQNRDDFAFELFDDGEYRVCLGPGTDHLAAKLEAHGMVQDPDVLDTWFSSALWPHSTLGWPEPTPELAKYYPTSVLSTARDIITLWVARMVIFGLHNVGEVPFRRVFIHPVIQDGKGQRMSKSLGNGIDPVDIIDLYGADTLRYTLASLATETQDLRMPVDQATLSDGRVVNTSERFELGRTFPTKLWNAARFALTNMEGYEAAEIDLATLPVEDRWILSGLARAATEVDAALENFRFAEAARVLRDFTWNSFCDWYVEFLKGRLRDPETRPTAQRVLAATLDGICRLLHPIMPFITEEIWQALGQIAPTRGIPTPTPVAESACIAPWPAYPADWADAEAEATVGQWQDKVGAIRNLRAERNVPPSAKVEPTIIASGVVAQRLKLGERAIAALTNSKTLAIVEAADRPTDAAVAVLADAEVILPLLGLVDKAAEGAKLRKQLAEVDKQLAGVVAKLGNEGFTSRAPAEVVVQLRAKGEELSGRREGVASRLAALTEGPAGP